MRRFLVLISLFTTFQLYSQDSLFTILSLEEGVSQKFKSYVSVLGNEFTGIQVVKRSGKSKKCAFITEMGMKIYIFENSGDSTKVRYMADFLAERESFVQMLKYDYDLILKNFVVEKRKTRKTLLEEGYVIKQKRDKEIIKKRAIFSSVKISRRLGANNAVEYLKIKNRGINLKIEFEPIIL